MVTHEMSRRVLKAIADCYPAAGPGVITAIDISQEQDDLVQVDIVHESQVEMGESFGPGQLHSLRTAVCEALEPWHHTVRTIELVP